MPLKKLFCVSTVCCLSLGVGVTAHAQFGRGIAVGSVHDASGAAIPGVSLFMRPGAMGSVFNTASNREGDYISRSAAGRVHGFSAGVTTGLFERAAVNS